MPIIFLFSIAGGTPRTVRNSKVPRITNKFHLWEIFLPNNNNSILEIFGATVAFRTQQEADVAEEEIVILLGIHICKLSQQVQVQLELYRRI